jgi:hypothetical protein
VSSDSFLDDDAGTIETSSQQHPSGVAVPGTLHNCNTSTCLFLPSRWCSFRILSRFSSLFLCVVEDFKKADKKMLMRRAAEALWTDTVSGSGGSKPHLLSRFVLLTFADLKKHVFLYWFCFPALALTQPAVTPAPANSPLPQLSTHFSQSELLSFWQGVCTLAGSSSEGSSSAPPAPAFFLTVRSGNAIQVLPLSHWSELSVDQRNSEDTMLACVDPSSLPGSLHVNLQAHSTDFAERTTYRMLQECSIMCIHI